MLSIKNYVKSFGKIEVLKVEDLLLESGVFWIKGENGSGKSTLLKSIAGIIDFKGDIILKDGINSKIDIVAYRKLINFAEAEANFPAFLTGKDMINLFANAKDATENQVDYYIKEMKMGEYVGELIGTYSSGMLKKLSIVLAFLGNPKIILLDEPLITLDTESVKILYRWINERFLSDQISFLISSHQALDLDNELKTKTILVQNNTVKLLKS
jgi:ABC-2 type transport system ATP-binding protein